MIEEVPVFKLSDKVLVKELNVEGCIYESTVSDLGHSIYGVRLDTVAYGGGLCTEVWHCLSEELQVAKQGN